MRHIITILFAVFLVGFAAAQSPLFYAFGNMPSRTIVSANTYNITLTGFQGGYKMYPDANWENSEITPGMVVWPSGGCIRLEITQIVSIVPLVLRVADPSASGALDGMDLINARVLILQESKVGNYNIGAFGNVADGNAGSQAGVGPFDFACVQNYYKQQTAAAISAAMSVFVSNRLSGNGTGGNPLDIAQQGATSGQVLKWNGTTWSPANDNVGAVTTNDLQGTDAVEITNGTGAILGPDPVTVSLSQQGATSGQVLKWNGTAWVPSNPPRNREQLFTATTGQTDFVLTGYIPDTQSGDYYPIRVYRNGIKLRYTSSSPPGILQYTYSGTTVVTASNTAGDEISVEYNQ